MFRPVTHPDVDAGQRTVASIPKAQLWQGRRSPNRRWVSFVVASSERPGTSAVMLARADGSSGDRFIQIAADHVWSDKPRWGTDGRTLYFISRHPGPYFNLWGVAFDPDRGTSVGEPVRLTAFDSPNLHISPDISRAEMNVSARHVVLTMKAVSGSIWMLDGVDR